MANRYWVGGTGNWDGTVGTKWSATSGGAGGASVPTNADDVFFDANSASGGANVVTINTGNTGAKSINCTGYDDTITGSVGISVAGSVTVSSAMTWSHTGTITFSGTGTLITAGKTFSGVTVGQPGITLTLGDNLNISTRTLTVNSGIFTTANFSVTAGILNSNNTSTRTINLGSSTVTLSSGTPVNFTTSTNLTFNAGTSQINLTSVTATFNGSGLTYYNVAFTGTTAGTRTITGGNTFNNLTLGNGSVNGINLVINGANQTINGTFTAAGVSQSFRLFVTSNLRGTPRTLTAAAESLSYCDFEAITGAGAGAPFTGTSLGDCGGNSNITFDAPVTRYWVSGTGSWNDTAKWSATSGGAGGATIPLPQDTAIINASSGASTGYLLNVPRIGTLDVLTSVNTVRMGTSNLRIYGSFLGDIDDNNTFNTVILSGRGSHTMSGCGINNATTLRIDAIGGTYTAVGNIGSATGNTFDLTSGTFTANTFDISVGSFSSTTTNTRTLNMGSGTWSLTRTATATVWDTSTTTGLTFNAQTSNIVISATTSSITRTFAGGGLTYNKLTLGGGAGTSQVFTLTGSNTFNEIAETKTVAFTLNLTAGTTTTVTTWGVSGSPGAVLTLKSATLAVATLAKAGGGTATVNYATISYLTGSPINTWYATNSTNGGNNTNIIFNVATANSAFFMLF